MATATEVWAEVAPRPEPKRDQYGRYLLPDGSGKRKPYTRATTWAATVDERSRLEKWQQRMVARGLCERRDLYLAASTAVDDDKALNRLCDQAIEAAKGSAGATIGTNLHALTERVDLGQEVSVPPPWDADLAAYRAKMAELGITFAPDMIERIVVCRTLEVAGTFDRLGVVPALGNLPVICDVKTGRFLPFTTIAIQLGLYAHADEMYDPATDTTTPMPEVNRSVGVVIHLPEGQGRCDLYTVDIAAGWQMAQTCGVVRRWRNRRDLSAPLDPAAALGVRRAYLQRRAERLRDAHADGLTLLAALWPAGVATFKASDAHEATELDAIEKVLVELESRFALPFLGGGDPDEGLIVLDSELMIERLKALPPDLLAAVEAQAAGKVPNLRSIGVRREHLDALEQVVGPVEAEAERRRAAARELVEAELGSDTDEFLGALASHVTAGEREWHRLTESDVESLRGVCNQLSAGTMCIAWDDNEMPIVRRVEAGAA